MINCDSKEEFALRGSSNERTNRARGKGPPWLCKENGSEISDSNQNDSEHIQNYMTNKNRSKPEKSDCE